jgi:hypothetical protein
MKKINLIIILLAISIHSLGQKQMVNTPGKVPEGYYMGNDGLFIVAYVKVEDEKVYADFVHIEKFPRDLYSETLSPDLSDSSFVGSTSRLYEKNGKYYITIEREGTAFGKMKIRLKHNEKGYKAGIENNRNYAAFNKFYVEYVDADKEDKNARSRFWDFYNKKQIGKEMESLKHADFLVRFAEYKKELEEKR